MTQEWRVVYGKYPEDFKKVFYSLKEAEAYMEYQEAFGYGCKIQSRTISDWTTLDTVSSEQIQAAWQTDPNSFIKTSK